MSRCKTCNCEVCKCRTLVVECPNCLYMHGLTATGWTAYACNECGFEIPHPNEPASEGVKFDGNKLPYHLIAPELLEAVAEILKFGVEKYGDRNWEKGMAWHRPFGACMRHMWAWWRGESSDPETGKSHLWHGACCIMFLLTYEMRQIGKDDRP